MSRYPAPPPGTERHERNHAAEAKRQGMPYRWVRVKGEWRFAASFSNTPSGRRKAAAVLRAGGKGGDQKIDERDARRLENETGGCFGCLLFATALASVPTAAVTAAVMIRRR